MVTVDQFSCDFPGCSGVVYGPCQDNSCCCGVNGLKQYCERHYEPKLHINTESLLDTVVENGNIETGEKDKEEHQYIEGLNRMTEWTNIISSRRLNRLNIFAFYRYN